MTSWLGIFYFESETSHDSQWNYYFGSCGVPLMAHSSGISEWMYHIWRSSTHSCERTLSFQFHVPWPLSLKPRQPFSIRGNRLLSVFFIFFSVVSIWQEWCVQQVCPIWLLTSELMARAFHCDGWGREVKRVYLTCVLKKKSQDKFGALLLQGYRGEDTGRPMLIHLARTNTPWNITKTADKAPGFPPQMVVKKLTKSF